MLTLIEVQCPHCKARGQVLLPPLGALIIGPCPECAESVLIFCGTVFPLNTAIIMDGSTEEKCGHISQTLFDFMRNRIGKVVEQLSPEETAEGLTLFPREENRDDSGPGPISDLDEEMFRQSDLDRLDDSEYFRAIFGTGKK